MKNLDKIITHILILTWVGFGCSTLKAEVVITEFFILQADNSHAPQYVELYNNSNSPIDLTDWSITTLDGDGELILESPFDNPGYVQANKMEIAPFGYFLISSSFCNYSTFGCNFYNEFQSESDIIAYYLILPFDLPFDDSNWNYIDKGSIVLTSDIHDTNVEEDRIDYDIATGWLVGENSRGHSLRLHSPYLDNSLVQNWKLSPETENSLWLYDEGEEIKNFGSPREENSFRLNGVEDFYHIISGDVNNIYNADNNYADNNYGVPLEFSWEGTFDDKPDQQYRLIIEKTNILKPEKHGFEIESFGDTTLIWESIIGIDTSIIPQSLLIDQLEFADYSWTIELTKTYSAGVDTIYSDRHYFSVDARDYGIYGCVDKSFCEISLLGFPTCPTTADDDTLFSNHPIECAPGVDCYSALNYYENANINSNTCHYVSLSIPAYVVGDINSTVRVPVYLYNDSLANIDSIAYTLSFDNSSGIAAFQEGTFSGTVETELWGDENIVGDQNGNISVSMLTPADSSFQGAGIITYLDFNLTGSQGEFINLSFSEVLVKGGIPENDISVPVSGGEVVILQTDYEIYGQVYYYDSSEGQEPFEVPNVELSLDKNYDGVSFAANYFEITNVNGFFKFDSLKEGNYSLSFSKETGNDCNGDYISGTDISRISRHVTGHEPFNADQIVAADVTLDGTVSGQDASLVAQYSVDLIDNFNDIKTHWIFQPFDLQTLPDVHAELVKENGQFSIKYKPLVLDDKSRNISAYRLGDVNGNYCYDHDQLLRYNNSPVQFTNIAVDYMPVITLPLIISEAIFLEGMDIEIGYDKDIFEPLSITFNSLNQQSENYESLSNLFSHGETIKTVTWALDDPQLINGIIGEVSFNWKEKNKGGKIWLENIQVNNVSAGGGISLISFNGEEFANGVNIINKLYPGKINLQQNYPNPFNPQTTIKWSMPLSGIVSLEVYNLQGQLIEHLFDGYKEVGMHEQEWDATAFPSGIYFYRLTTNKKTFQKVMLLLK